MTWVYHMCVIASVTIVVVVIHDVVLGLSLAYHHLILLLALVLY